MLKINKTQARKHYNAGSSVWVVGDKVSEYHIKGGWHLGVLININDYPDQAVANGALDFDNRVAQHEWYLEPELGRRMAYYLEHINVNGKQVPIYGHYQIKTGGV